MGTPEAVAPSHPPPARTPTSWGWLLAGLGLFLAVAWLVLRPAAPQGVAAVVDLLVLPSVLCAEVRLLAGRPTLPALDFAVFLGLGAVFAGLTALGLERVAGLLAGPSALPATGPVVEGVAICTPLLWLALSARRQRLTVADTTLAGLATGVGFLVVQSSLATGALHVAPEYVSPLLAGFARVPASAGSPPAFFVGSALAAALVGLALGLGLRLRSPSSRLVPAALALSLVIFDHGLFDWRLRHLLASKPARASGLLDVAQAVTLHGRLAVVLLAAGLVGARQVGQGQPTEAAPAADGPDHHENAPPPAEPAARAEPEEPDEETEPGPRPDLPTWVSWLAMVVAVSAGVALTVLARNRQLGFLDRSEPALAVSLLGLGYSLWQLPAGRSPAPGPDVRLLLGAAAVTSSLIGTGLAFLPPTDAPAAAHGTLLVETVLGWGAHVGNLGLLLGIGGLAAPPGGHRKRRYGDRWSGLLLRRLPWRGWSASDRAGRAGGGRGERLSLGGRDGRRRRRESPDGGPGGSFLWLKVSGGRWGKLLGGRGRRREASEQAGAQAEQNRAVALTVEPIYRSHLPQTEFVGATVKEAIEAAMRQVGVGLAHNALQLIDEGTPSRPGKPGSGRPARVRVTEAGEDADEILVPPARNSITRDTPFVVLVETAGGEKKEPPASINVVLRVSHPHRGNRILACPRVDSSAERSRYRSNPYAVEGGEDTTLARVHSDAAAAASGLRVNNGGQVTVEYRGERAALTVYDGWSQQVVGVNRWLLDLTGEHHRRLVAHLEDQLALLEDPDTDTDRIRQHIGRLRDRLRSVETARDVLSAPRTEDPGTHDDAKSFGSTGLLHAAMSVEEADVSAAAGAALAAYRRAVATDPATEVAATAYRDFLLQTVPGQLWASGAYSADDVAALLGWERFAPGVA